MQRVNQLAFGKCNSLRHTNVEYWCKLSASIHWLMISCYLNARKKNEGKKIKMEKGVLGAR